MAHTVDVRAADVDRERVIAELQQHTSAGRLSMDEFSERAAAVYRSRTMSELDALTADLPARAESPYRQPFLVVAVVCAAVDRTDRGASRGGGAGLRRPTGLQLVTPNPSPSVIVDVRAAPLVAVRPGGSHSGAPSCLRQRQYRRPSMVCRSGLTCMSCDGESLQSTRAQRGIGALWLENG